MKREPAMAHVETSFEVDLGFVSKHLSRLPDRVVGLRPWSSVSSLVFGVVVSFIFVLFINLLARPPRK